MYYRIDEIYWDESKAKKVKDEHAIEFAKIIDIFEDSFAVEFIDEAHSTGDETRYAIIGASRYGLVYLVFTEPKRTALYHGAFGGKLDGQGI